MKLNSPSPFTTSLTLPVVTPLPESNKMEFTIRYRRKRSGRKCMHDNVKYGHINQAELKSNIDPQECSIYRIIISRGVTRPMHKEHITHSIYIYIQKRHKRLAL